MEDADEEDPNEDADSSLLQLPSLVSAAVKKLKSSRKKIGRRNPAKPPSSSAPLRKPTAPMLATTRKKTPSGAESSSKPSETNAPT